MDEEKEEEKGEISEEAEKVEEKEEVVFVSEGEGDDSEKDWVMDDIIDAKLVSKAEMERIDRIEE